MSAPRLQSAAKLACEASPPGQDTKTSTHEASASGRSVQQAAVFLGRIVGLGERGAPLVAYAENPTRQPVEALATVQVGASQVGADVTLSFVAGDPRRPVVCGILRPSGEAASTKTAPGRRVSVGIDGDTLAFTAEREIVLRCGKASITLQRNGRLVLRGTHLVSRSSGVNRLRGGSIQLN